MSDEYIKAATASNRKRRNPIALPLNFNREIPRESIMISWIKLDINILDDAKIKIIRSHPDGNSIVILWIGLLCLAMKSARPGIIEISNGLPYTVDDLANAFGIEKKTVELGLVLFRKYQMIDVFDGNTIEVVNFSKHQSIEEIERKRDLTRTRVKRYREKLKCNALLTHDSRNVTLTDKTRQDKTREDKTKRIGGAFQAPSIEQVKEYCSERNNNISPEVFISHYQANGWLVGKNKMKDWKATIRNWEAREVNNGAGNGFTGSKSAAITKTGAAQSDGTPWPADREY
jgi:predicted phage replisome organizer